MVLRQYGKRLRDCKFTRTKAGILGGDTLTAHGQSREVERERGAYPGIAGFMVPAVMLERPPS